MLPKMCALNNVTVEIFKNIISWVDFYAQIATNLMYQMIAVN